MYRVGITGGIGSGKSLVARMLEVLGVPVFHADAAGKDLLDHDPVVKEQVMRRFGTGTYGPEGLDRKALAAIIFKDPQARADLNAIVHPAVRQRFADWAAERNKPIVAMEAAILVETGGHANFDHLVVVTAPEEIRLQRVMERDGTDAASVQARMQAQAPEEEVLVHADTVIINDGRQLLIPQVLALHSGLVRAAAE